MQLCHQIIHFDLGRSYYKNDYYWESETVDNKLERNKAQYIYIDKTAKISALSSENASKYEFLIGKGILLEKKLPRKSRYNEKFWLFAVGQRIESTVQNDIAKQQYQTLDDSYDFEKIIKKEKPALQKCSKSDLIYDSNYSFYKYYLDSK